MPREICGAVAAGPSVCGRSPGHAGAHIPTDSWTDVDDVKRLVGMLTPPNHVVQAVLLLWQMAEALRPDPEHAGLVARFDQMVGKK